MKRNIVWGSAVTLLLLICARPAAAQVPAFPSRGAAIIDALVPQFPGGAPGATDDQRRELTKAVIEQLVCEFPADGYTWKSADPGRPPSKDAIGRQVNGHLYAWDWQNGGTRARAVQPGQPAEDITGQNPITVGCVQHLGSTPTLPPPGGEPSHPAPNVGDVDEGLAALHAEFDAFRAGAPTSDQLERIFANLTDQLQNAVLAEIKATHQSLEDHRAEARKTRSAVMAVLTNKYVQLIGAGAFAKFGLPALGVGK
jgi:hypothetical protein